MSADRAIDWRRLHIERHIRIIERGQNSPEACCEIVWWEMRQPFPDFSACIEAMTERGIPSWEAARIIGRVVEEFYPISSRDSIALNQYVRDAHPSMRSTL